MCDLRFRPEALHMQLEAPHVLQDVPRHLCQLVGLEPFWWAWVLSGVPGGCDPDSWIERARQWRVNLAGCHPDNLENPDCGDPDVYEAWRLCARGKPWMRFELEARLLAGQADLAIAEACQLRPDAVAAYHALFYRVRDRLTHKGTILGQAIGTELFTAPSAGAFIRYVCWIGGPVTADGVLGVLRKLAAGEPLDPPSEATIATLRRLYGIISRSLGPEEGLQHLQNLRDRPYGSPFTSAELPEIVCAVLLQLDPELLHSAQRLKEEPVPVPGAEHGLA